MKEKVKRVMQINNSITVFSDIFLGGAVMILCGAVGLAFYATLQKVFKMLGRVYTGYLQKKYADRDLVWLAKVSVRCEALNGLVRAFGMLVIPFSTVGILIVGVGHALYGLDRAFGKLYQERVVDLISKDVTERMQFFGELSYYTSIWDFIGMATNFAIFSAGYFLHANELVLLHGVCFAYGILKIIDVLTSFIERRVVLKLLSQK